MNAPTQINQLCCYQGITTKYLGCTDYQPSRVKAKTAGGHTLTMSWEHEWNQDVNHRLAAEQLATKLGWLGTVSYDGETFNRVLLQGSAPGNWAYMFVIMSIKKDSLKTSQIEFNETATENLDPVESPTNS